VFVTKSYHRAASNVKYVEEMDEDEKEMNIPLPSPASLVLKARFMTE
jgi:hypothetical protein